MYRVNYIATMCQRTQTWLPPPLSGGCHLATVAQHAYTGMRLSRLRTEGSNFISMVVFGLAMPLTGTKCAVTLHA